MEDSGGIHGHTRLVEALKDPSHPEHEFMREWTGDAYDPEVFDLTEINLVLANFAEEVKEGQDPFDLDLDEGEAGTFWVV